MGILTPPKKKGLLGDPAAMLRAAPDIYAPMLPNGGEQLPMDEQPMARPQPMLGDVASLQAPIRKPGFFEDGGVGRRLAGTLGDTLATWAGGQAVYEPMMERRQALQHEQQVHDRDLQDSISKFRAEQEWKLAHPAPINNDTANDYEFIRAHRGQGAADQYLDNVANKPRVEWVTDPTTGARTLMEIPSSGASSAPQGLPPGVTLTPIGGPTPSASGTFPDWRGAPGTMTSGRRTVEGNRLVGGVPNSGHLRGDKADYVGTTADALRAYYGPAAKILDERTHLDVSLPGYGRFPYYGKRGTTGLN